MEANKYSNYSNQTKEMLYSWKKSQGKQEIQPKTPTLRNANSSSKPLHKKLKKLMKRNSYSLHVDIIATVYNTNLKMHIYIYICL